MIRYVSQEKAYFDVKFGGHLRVLRTNRYKESLHEVSGSRGGKQRTNRRDIWEAEFIGLCEVVREKKLRLTLKALVLEEVDDSVLHQ